MQVTFDRNLPEVESVIWGIGPEKETQPVRVIGWTTLTTEKIEKVLADWTNLFYFELPHRQASTDVTAQVETTLWRISSREIIIPRPAEVRDYLVRYPDMTDLVESVSELSREKLGTDAQLSLEVYHDPEVEDEYLTLYIRQDTYDDHLLDVIDEVCAEYESALVGRSGWLLVTTDFHPPA